MFKVAKALILFLVAVSSLMLFPEKASAVTRSELIVNSEPGDFIGGGRNYKYDLANNSWRVFSARAEGVQQATQVRIIINSEANGEFWILTFDSGQLGAPLVPGEYANAKSANFAPPGTPILEVSGTGTGCSSTGRFTILHAEFDYSYRSILLVSFAALFEQQCLGSSSKLSGEIYYNYNTTGQTGAIRGRITDRSGNGLVGVGVILSGGKKAITMTDANGNYAFTGLISEDDYTVSLFTNYYKFFTGSKTVSNLTGEQVIDFSVAVPKPPERITGLRLVSDLREPLGHGQQINFNENDGVWESTSLDQDSDSVVDTVIITFSNASLSRVLPI